MLGYMKTPQSRKLVSAIIITAAVIAVGVALTIWYFNSLPQPEGVGRPNNTVVPERLDPMRNTTSHDSDSIWSGYVAHGQTFIAVEGKVRVPSVKCTNEDQSFTAWVGFGGYEVATVEQTGFAITCHNAIEYAKYPAIDGVWYYSWALMYGSGPSKTFSVEVRPGDEMLYRVEREGESYHLTVKNLTLNQTDTTTEECHQLDSASAEGMRSCAIDMVEWIVERAGHAAMLDFGKVHLYDNKATTEDGKTMRLDELPNTRIHMANSTDTMTETGLIQDDGSFDIIWKGTGVAGKL